MRCYGTTFFYMQKWLVCKVFQILKTIVRIISCCTKRLDLFWDVGKETKRNKGVETLRLKKSKRGNEITRYSTNTSYIVLYDHNNLKHFRTIYDPLHQNNVNMTWDVEEWTYMFMQNIMERWITKFPNKKWIKLC